MLASDLMGLGVSPLLAARTATGGIGPLTAVAAGSSFATATKIQCTQFLVSVSGGDGTKGVALPTIGGDAGAFLADDFIINNLAGSSMVLYASVGVNISSGGSNANTVTQSTHTTMTLYPISTTQWIAVRGS